MKKILLCIFLSFFTVSTAANAKTNSDSGKQQDTMALLHDNTPLTPVKVFDNICNIGTVSVSCYIITTEEGIILIDSMWDNNDARLIENGMQKLGLDPKEIKYVFVTHGHGDHYGGAKYFRDKYQAKVLMSKTDSELMYSLNTGPNSPRSPKTEVDIFVKDGDVLTLGNTAIRIYETPGHTAGCLSITLPVQYNGKKYQAIIWGGTGLPKNDTELLKQYVQSAQKFQQIAQNCNAEIKLSVHLFEDNGYKNLEKAAAIKTNEQNPFVIGQTGVQNYLKRLENNAKKKLME